MTPTVATKKLNFVRFSGTYQWCKWALSSLGMLCGIGRYFVTSVSGQSIRSIFKGLLALLYP